MIMKKTCSIFATLLFSVITIVSCISNGFGVSYNGNDIIMTMDLHAGAKDIYDMEEEIFQKMRKGEGIYNISLTVKSKDKYGKYSISKSYNLGSWSTNEIRKYASYNYFRGQIYTKVSNAINNKNSEY
ncbi:hypothetical protein [Bacteroides ovatus]|uniref:hypothetical protein n=2 Tax=Bacteroides TaxID=816 RepID=UPI00319E2FF1